MIWLLDRALFETELVVEEEDPTFQCECWVDPLRILLTPQSESRVDPWSSTAPRFCTRSALPTPDRFRVLLDLQSTVGR